MSEIKILKKLLKARTALKRLQSLSFDISIIEKRYDIQTLQAKDMEEILSIYTSMESEIYEIAQQLELIREEKAS